MNGQKARLIQKKKTFAGTFFVNRTLSYVSAINEALNQMMEADPSLLLIGQGVKSPWYVGNTCKDLISKFGESRIIDTPVSENAMTGAAIGAAATGSPSISIHPRMDFMLYALDPIINQAANWFYMNGGKVSLPVVFWGIINRGGEQAAQHSQSLHSTFSHMPGLKVVMPSTPYDAKGLMVSAIKDKNPVVFVDDRWLYEVEGDVPKENYSVPIGKGSIRKQGKDLTVIANSFVCHEAVIASNLLEKEGLNVEVLDLRTIKPLDKDLILQSVSKTGRAIIIDGGWKSFGVASEISATITEEIFDQLKGPTKRLCLEDCPAPASRTLEAEYYITRYKIASFIKTYFKQEKIGVHYDHPSTFC